MNIHVRTVNHVVLSEDTFRFESILLMELDNGSIKCKNFTIQLMKSHIAKSVV
ncbi:Uncharacterised protein [Pseudomonas aeruginosa]|nr:hypothetical protein [Pseudomonas sp. S68]SUC76189.1 Uncharacterised protein [Pseudomonas aeruginosa]